MRVWKKKEIRTQMIGWKGVREKLTNWEHDWERHIRNWIISQFDLKDLVLSAIPSESLFFLPMKFRHSSVGGNATLT